MLMLSGLAGLDIRLSLLKIKALFAAVVVLNTVQRQRQMVPRATL